MIPDRTSPVPAVASRSSPLATTSTSPPGAATTVAGPLSSTTVRRSAASWRAASEPVGGRPMPGEQPVLAVVRREHRRRRAPVRRTGAAPSAFHARANRPSPSTTTGRWRRPPWPRTAATVVGSRPRPGPTTRAWKRSRSSSDLARPSRTPAAAAARPPSGADRRRCRASTACTIPLPARIAAADARCGGARHAGLPATTARRGCHLCASVGAAATTRRRRLGLDEVGPGPTGVEADVGHLDVAGQDPPGGEEQAGLERGERHRAVGGEHATAGCRR